MPVYQYFCDANQRTLEVIHPMDTRLQTWLELCYVAQIDPGETDPAAPVRKVIKSPPGIAVETFNSELKNVGFTKLVKRDDGVYENVTALDDEKRYMVKGDEDSVPKLHKKISD